MTKRNVFLFALLAVYQLATLSSIEAATSSSSGSSDSGAPSNAVKVAAIAAILCGAVLCFFGYRLTKPTIFLCGFILFGYLGSSLVKTIFKSQSWVGTTVLVSFIVVGLCGGMLALCLYKFGIFVVGATYGMFLAILINDSVIHDNTVLIVMSALLGIGGGILALKKEQPVLIIATSFMGADLAVSGIGYFAGIYPSDEYRKLHHHKDSHGVPSALGWHLAAMVVLVFVGATIQFNTTSDKNKSERNSDAACSTPV